MAEARRGPPGVGHLLEGEDEGPGGPAVQDAHLQEVKEALEGGEGVVLRVGVGSGAVLVPLGVGDGQDLFPGQALGQGEGQGVRVGGRVHHPSLPLQDHGEAQGVPGSALRVVWGRRISTTSPT